MHLAHLASLDRLEHLSIAAADFFGHLLFRLGLFVCFNGQVRVLRQKKKQLHFLEDANLNANKWREDSFLHIKVADLLVNSLEHQIGNT